MEARVALTAGDNRFKNVSNALELIKDDVDLTAKKDVFIKVNFVDTRNQICSTHPDGVRALLEFLRSRYSGRIRIGESHIFDEAIVPFRNFGYIDLLKEYDVEIVDLRDDQWNILHLYDADMNPIDIHYSKTMMDSDYLVSIGPPKTHDMVIVTLSIKNVVMGGPSHRYDDKMKIHQGPPVMNLDLYLMATQNMPKLAVLDGFQAMEGNGPVGGTGVDWKIAVASTDAVAADCFTSDLMGFPPGQVGYLTYLGKKGYGVSDLSRIEVLGEDPEDHRMRFKPHDTFDWQRGWPDEKVNRFLGL